MADTSEATVGVRAVHNDGHLVAFNHSKGLPTSLQQPSDAIVVHFNAPTKDPMINAISWYNAFVMLMLSGPAHRTSQNILHKCVKAKSNCSDNENDNDYDRNLLVELLHTEWAHAYSNNRGGAFLSFSFSLSGPVWPGLKSS